MKTLPAALQAHLDTGATTLCWCWRVTRNDGTVLGFTDHDRDLAFDEIAFEAASGFAGSEIASSVGLAVDNLDVRGALTSDRLDERELAAGLFDNALVEIFRVNWRDPAQRVLMRYGNLGEVSRGARAFQAEVRGLAHELQQPRGRMFQFGCDADLGDARCGKNLDQPAFRGAGLVTGIGDARTFAASGLDAFANDWFSRGLLTWDTGANAGRGMEVKLHTALEDQVLIELWQAMSEPVAAGDAFTATAGCDKQFATCRAKFDNAVNYRGFPHMPGNDFLVSYPNAGDKNLDGRALAD